MYFLIGGTYYNTIDGDPECSEAVGNTVTFTFPVTGTVTEVGFVYDRGDTGSVTYSNAMVAGVTLGDYRSPRTGISARGAPAGGRSPSYPHRQWRVSRR